jgi:hypothetical protein
MVQQFQEVIDAQLPPRPDCAEGAAAVRAEGGAGFILAMSGSFLFAAWATSLYLWNKKK